MRRAAGKEGEQSSFIRAHKDTNALVITAPPAITRELRNVIRQLDIRRAQVLIEAIVAEVNDQTARELGIQWQATDDDFSDRGFIGGTNFPGSTGNGGIFGVAQNPGLLAGASGLNIGYILGTAQLPGSDDRVCPDRRAGQGADRRQQHQHPLDPVDDDAGPPGSDPERRPGSALPDRPVRLDRCHHHRRRRWPFRQAVRRGQSHSRPSTARKSASSCG
jgi:hypothetical protein